MAAAQHIEARKTQGAPVDGKRSTGGGEVATQGCRNDNYQAITIATGNLTGNVLQEVAVR
ncbi:hypothetical protein O9K51_05633 [Purpureocillium lavendulum]|uniref:Uncharacterized protein n=1 Tax=Purpureocillium lavendulum TaxID=1247861 RepID=A0AB34FTD6_9HYPO|nr:hypothetical protein O9K51_05633 [Purpureocillium lavendulum]